MDDIEPTREELLESLRELTVEALEMAYNAHTPVADWRAEWKKEWPDDFKRVMRAVGMLTRAGIAIDWPDQEKEQPLSPVEAKLLGFIRERQPCGVEQLGELAGLSKGWTAANLSSLRRRGLIESRPGVGRRRTYWATSQSEG